MSGKSLGKIQPKPEISRLELMVRNEHEFQKIPAKPYMCPEAIKKEVYICNQPRYKGNECLPGPTCYATCPYWKQN
jgi:hypothetical protein